jgi:hypothetical protein
MKVRKENADLINFYFKQGHAKMTKKKKTLGHSFGKKKITIAYLSNIFL